MYIQDLPEHQYDPYCYMNELLCVGTDKKRLVCCKDREASAQFRDLFNLVSCYRTYEQLLLSGGSHPSDKKQGGQHEGPKFISAWVEAYLHHHGEMTFNAESLSDKNLPYLLQFARHNDSIKALTFGQQVQFDGERTGNYMGISTEKLIEHIGNILHDFPDSSDGIKKLKFEGNNMTNDTFKKVY